MTKDKEHKNKKAAEKYNLNDVEDIWQSLLDEDPDAEEELFEGESLLYGDSYAEDPDEAELEELNSGGEEFEEEDLLYEDTYADLAEEEGEEPEVEETEAVDLTEEGAAESDEEEEPLPEETVEAVPAETECAAVVTFSGGMSQEVARARLFHPQENTVWLVDEETGDELSVSMEQLASIQLAGLPSGISARHRRLSRPETIETVDGSRHRVLVSPEQDLEGLLCCFPVEKESAFPIILFPVSSITARTRRLQDILLEKRFLSPSILKRAKQEFAKLKDMPFEKVLAQRTRIPLAEIKQALDNAEQNQMIGMQPGEILLISGLVNEEQVLDAIEYQEHLHNLSLHQFLIERRYVHEAEMYTALAEKHGIPYVDLRQRKIPREYLTLLPQSVVERYDILPLVKKDDALLTATSSVNSLDHRDAIARAAGCRQVKFVLSPPSQIRKIIRMIHAQGK